MLLRLMCQWPGLKGGILRLKRKVAYTGLIETAKLNGLDPYRYLLHVLMTAPGRDLKDPSSLTALMPWNTPPDCAAKSDIPISE